MVKRLSIFAFFYLLPFFLIGQSLISYVTVNPNNAYIGQPIELKVSVYSSTWFTSGIDVGNIKVDGALTVFFRSVSNTKTFNNKSHAGVDFYYNLFPTKDGIIEIPSLTINVESPKEGDYKGIKKSIKTKPKKVTVKGVPLGYDPNNWLVATYLSVNQNWSQSLSSIKVGDVVKRTITRNAGSTLSEFIPSTKSDSISGISIYPNRSKVNTTKTKTSVSARRIETSNYLFEKEGEITIPSIEYVYWNSSNKRFYRKHLDSIVVNVKPNADLEMLASIKKSLQKEKIKEEETEDKPFLILGLEPLEFAKYLLILIVLALILFWIVKKIFFQIKTKYNRYINSEAYAFRLLKQAIKNRDYPTFVKLSNAWLTKVDNKLNGIHGLAIKTKSTQLSEILNIVNKTIFKQNKACSNYCYKQLLKEISIARKKYFSLKRKDADSENNGKDWLNPIK